LIGSGEAQERGIVGDTPNLVARLQGIAEPNMVIIADSRRRLLGNLFELEETCHVSQGSALARPSRCSAIP
jgi:class 3 adenylate cyclase